MIQVISLAQLAEATQGALHIPENKTQKTSPIIHDAVTDSRALTPNCVFFALVGDKYDAHDFLDAVSFHDDVVALVVSKPLQNPNLPYVLVDDTTRAYGFFAAWLRQKWQRPLAAITGSCGKTTVKTLLASICQQQGETLATQGNLNNHIGVPHTLLSLQPEHEYAVVEMGASGVGEIAYLAHLASPQVALVNNAMPAHVEGFGSLAAIVREKGQIYRALDQGGVAVLNLDDPHADEWRVMIGERKVLGFSAQSASADIWAENIRMNNRGCAEFLLHTPVGSKPISLQVLGRHNVSNALAATACALALGVTLDNIALGLSTAESAPGRLEWLEISPSIHLINDAYNANPGSVKVGIDCLMDQQGWRCLVLGDMAELGSGAVDAHRSIGAYAAEKGVNAILLLGDYSQNTKEGAEVAKKGSENVSNQCQQPLVETFLSHETLSARLQELLNNKAADSVAASILIKGSRSSYMERVTKMISKAFN